MSTEANIQLNSGDQMNTAAVKPYDVIKYIHSGNPNRTSFPQLLRIDDDLQLVEAGIRQQIERTGPKSDYFLGVARETYVVVQMIDEDSILNIHNSAKTDGKETKQIVKYTVVAVGDKVSNIFIGDNIEFFPSRVQRLSIEDDLSREEIHKSLRRMRKSDMEQLIGSTPRLSYQTFFIVNSIDIYFKYHA